MSRATQPLSTAVLEGLQGSLFLKVCRHFSGPSFAGEGYSPISRPIYSYCQGGSSTWRLGNSKSQRCGSDHNQKCHLALSPESTLLPWKCVAASIPIPGSLREWQECQGDVNEQLEPGHVSHPTQGRGVIPQSKASSTFPSKAVPRVHVS